MESGSVNPDIIITPNELKGCIESVTLLDVREPEEYEVSFIPGTLLIPLGELQLRAEAELNKKADIVIYCAHGVRSLYGVSILKQLGFEKLRSLQGGIAAWEVDS